MRCVFYCGAEHQTASWPNHKSECTRLAGDRIATEVLNSTLDPLATDFSWNKYYASSHRKPLPPNNRPPRQLSVTTSGPEVSERERANMMNPWYPEKHFTGPNKRNAYAKLVDGFALWQDDCILWKGVQRGLYSAKDPYPEFLRFLERAKPHLPHWWTERDSIAVKVVARAKSTDAGTRNVYDTIEKEAYNELYKSPLAAMAMRLWVDRFSDVKIGS
ncbi:hypothetical protein JCM11491_003796 [Sporobolomyces phaffii]